MVYASRGYEGALLEQFVYAVRGRLARNRVASRIVIPDDLDVPALDIAEHPGRRDEVRLRQIGSAWVASEESVPVLVPSFVASALGMERGDQPKPSGVRPSGRCRDCRCTLGSVGD